MKVKLRSKDLIMMIEDNFSIEFCLIFMFQLAIGGLASYGLPVIGACLTADA